MLCLPTKEQGYYFGDDVIDYPVGPGIKAHLRHMNNAVAHLKDDRFCIVFEFGKGHGEVLVVPVSRCDFPQLTGEVLVGEVVACPWNMRSMDMADFDLGVDTDFVCFLTRKEADLVWEVVRYSLTGQPVSDETSKLVGEAPTSFDDPKVEYQNFEVRRWNLMLNM